MSIALARFLFEALFVAPVFIDILMRLSGISLRDLLDMIAPSVFAACTVVATVFLFQISGCMSEQRPVLQLVAETAVGGLLGDASYGLWKLACASLSLAC